MKGKTVKERARRYAEKRHPSSEYPEGELEGFPNFNEDVRDEIAYAYLAGFKAGLRQKRKESGE